MDAGSGLTFQQESWAALWGDPQAQELGLEHYAEFEGSHQRRWPYGPDVETYELLDSRGMLSVTTARRAGRLRGYVVLVIKRHMHYPALCAFEDAYFLTRSERRGLTGYRLLAASVEAARRRGCERAFYLTKLFLPMGVLLQRLGFTQCDEMYGLWFKGGPA